MIKPLPIVLFFLFMALRPVAASYYEKAVKFENNGSSVTGKLMLPKQGDGPFPVAVFVHGDGALPYDAHGYYRYLWDELAKKGIASFSWNKPGINGSFGDWELQSMHERAAEVNQAIAHLRSLDDIKESQIGMIGFSQAGWVIPLVDQKDIAFNIIVSGAINWLQQGNYLTRQRLRRQGTSEKDIENAIAANALFTQKRLPSLKYSEYKNIHDRESAENPKNRERLMSRSRFEFAKKNWRYDSTRSLKNLKSPTLFIFGEDDEYVDTDNSIDTYSQELVSSSKGRHRISVYPSAQHGLLKSKHFQGLKPGIWFIVKMEFLGKHAFADNFLSEVADWASQSTE